MKPKTTLHRLSALSLIAAAAHSFAQAPIEDLPSPAQKQQAVVAAIESQQQSNSYYQMQLLQEEVRELRGTVEELQYQIQQLKQRQLDDYMDLDRRIAAIASGKSTVVTDGNDTPKETVTDSEDPTPDGDEAAKADYSNAYNLLRQRKVDESLAAFTRHIEMYPTGVYAANAYYWQGEIYLLKNELEKARQSFTQVVTHYQDNRKYEDAAFKLGKVYHQLGDEKQAKQWLTKVAAGKSSASALAKQYLETAFPAGN